MKTETIEIDQSDGTIKEYKILIGENATDNEKIIKISSQNSIWMHFENVSGPHLILQNNGDEIPKRYLNEVASRLFKYKQKVARQNIIYTNVGNIKLTNIPGKVITKNIKIIRF
jgi:predicted ribosome quality control (RQC) complex YloA/Tae2 family protein